MGDAIGVPLLRRDIIVVRDPNLLSMNNTPELVRLADSITSLAASLADLIQAQIKAVCNEGRIKADHASEVGAEKSTPTPQSDGKLLYDIHQAAELLSVCPMTVRRLMLQNRLSRIPNVRKVLIPYDELRKFVATAE